MYVPSYEALRTRCCEPTGLTLVGQRRMIHDCMNCLERQTAAGDSPVIQGCIDGLSKLKYHGARETPWEAGPPTVQDYPTDRDR